MTAQREHTRFGQELPAPERMGPMARTILAHVQGSGWAGCVWGPERDLGEDVSEYLASVREAA